MTPGSKRILYINAFLSSSKGEAVKQQFAEWIRSSKVLGDAAEVISLDLHYGRQFPALVMGTYFRTEGFDLVVLSGSELNTTDREDPRVLEYLRGLADLLDLNRETSLQQWSGPSCPVLGICFGHQALAVLFHGETTTLGRREGLVAVRGLTSSLDHPSFAEFYKFRRPTSGEFLMCVENADFVVRLPVGFRLALSTVVDPQVEGLIHDQWPILTIQGHPEYGNAENESANYVGAWIRWNFRSTT